MVKAFNSYVAQIAEVSLEGGNPRIHKVWCAVDCGVAVNPDQIAAQVEGSFAYGLSAALYSECTIDGGKVVQETRLYDPDKDETRSMRSKEDAMDYRYFPDPDLLPLAITPQWIEAVKATLPELPGAKQSRYTGEYGLSAYDARLLTQSREWSDYFEAVLAATAIPDRAGAAKAVANLMTGELAATLNRSEASIAGAPVTPEALAGLVRKCVDGTLNNKLAKEVFAAMWAGEGDADTIIEKRGLKQISDSGEIEKIVDQVLAANAKSVEEFRAGKEKAFNALVGQVMKATKGKANPAQVNDLLKKKLGG